MSEHGEARALCDICKVEMPCKDVRIIEAESSSEGRPKVTYACCEPCAVRAIKALRMLNLKVIK